MTESEFYRDKFDALERAIGKIETMLERLMVKEEDRISRIVELEVKALQQDERAEKQKKDLDELWAKFKNHCYEQQSAPTKAVQSAMKWIILISGAIAGVAVIIAALVWWLQRLGVV